MSHVITHFMWSYQSHFQIVQRVNAKTLFRTLDERFDPEVFLVGVRVADDDKRYPACVDPESDFWIESDAFDDVLQRADRIVPTYPESRLVHSHPLAQKWHDDSLQKRAIRDGIAEVISECGKRPESMRHFISWPVRVDAYLVSMVVGLQKEVLESYPRLKIDRLWLHECRSYSVPTSIFEAVMDEYLTDAAGVLLTPDPGADFAIGKSPDEIRRAAGNRMMSALAERTDNWDNQLGYERLLFDACNRISALRYERGIAKGRLVLARRDHPALTAQAAFRKPVDAQNERAVRKLLELATGTLAIHMNSKEIWGMVELGDYDAEAEDLFEINVLDYHTWEVAHAGSALMHVRDGLPSVPRPSVDPGKLRADIVRIFAGICDADSERLISLVSAAEKEPHGAMLVISRDAPHEAERLKNQATLLEPRLLTPERVLQLTPIDGAVLLEPNGVCHAIGVILDGLTTNEGNPARGARFNSAVRYVAGRKHCLAIVFSEDGGVDLIPNLLPPIRQSAIETRLSELDEMVTRQHIPHRYIEIMDWFHEHRSYLIQQHCERLNALVKEIDALRSAEYPDAPQIIRHEFIPQDGLDEAMYYERE